MGDRAISGHMKKAQSNLDSARILYANSMYDSAVSSSYYAIFHAVSALLASRGMEFSKHKTVIKILWIITGQTIFPLSAGN